MDGFATNDQAMIDREGAVLVYSETVSVAGAGAITFTVTTFRHQRLEIEILDLLSNDGAAARNASAIIDDGHGNTIANLLGDDSGNVISVADGLHQAIPAGAATANAGTPGKPITIGGGLRLVVTLAAVSASGAATLAMVAKFWGDLVPTFSATGADTPTVTRNALRVLRA